MGYDFLTTRWSLVLAARGEDSLAQDALQRLCADIWKPLYAFARRWGRSPEDAEDSVQGFLGSMLKRESFQRIDRERGRFRTFLLGAMRNFLSDEDSRRHAVKRGGHAVVVSLDFNTAERDYCTLAAAEASPERAFERSWAMEVVMRARTKLQEECAASGKGPLFDVLFPKEENNGSTSGEENARHLGMTVNAYRTATTRLRQRWRVLIREELAQTVSCQVDLDAEMQALKEALME